MTSADDDRILAFRLARSGLAARKAPDLAAAAACPASDFARDAAITALAARCEAVSKESFDEATDAGERLVVAHVVRGAIHALRADDLALLGRSLISAEDEELGRQLGTQVQRLAAAKGFAPIDALDEVAEATKSALARGRKLSKNELHDELRTRVGEDLMPWCKGCGSHHVAPMLWRYGGVQAGARLDSERRYVLGKPGRAPSAVEAVRRFLRFYAPATPADFADWAGVAKPHAARLWEGAAAELEPFGGVGEGSRRRWVLSADVDELSSPPSARGVRLIPPGDPYLQKPNKALLAPAAELRKRLFRPVASPGAVLKDGSLVGLWRVKAKGHKTEISVEKLGRIARRDLADEAERIAALRGTSGFELVVD